MADNYLEQRMEDFRSGKLSSTNRQMAVNSLRKNGLNIQFPPRKVLVTGGANGIGLAIVRSFLKTGCKVAVIDKDGTAGEKLAHNEGVRFYNVDLSDREELENALSNLFSAWKDLDIVVSNAGISTFQPLEDSDPDMFDKIIDTNLRPTYIIARAWARHRKKFPIPNNFGGRLITISSTRHIQSEKGTEGYSASKGAIASLTHALMMSLAEFGITVNCISPGWIHTGVPNVLTEADHKQHPSGRVGKPEDIARLCVFLSLPDNNFINGADIPVDGGMTRKMIYIE